MTITQAIKNYDLQHYIMYWMGDCYLTLMLQSGVFYPQTHFLSCCSETT